MNSLPAFLPLRLPTLPRPLHPSDGPCCNSVTLTADVHDPGSREQVLTFVLTLVLTLVMILVLMLVLVLLLILVLIPVLVLMLVLFDLESDSGAPVFFPPSCAEAH